MDCADIAVAILAAGRATRFGSDKLMVPLDGVPLGLHIAQTLAPMGFGWCFAVCRIHSPVAERYTALNFNVIRNPKAETGQSHSLHLAVAEAQKTVARGLLITLADMPFITACHIDAIIRTGSLAASDDGINVMPPAMFPRRMWPELWQTSGDTGARELFGQAKRIAASPHILRDIDMESDLPASK
jgi:molybdenum cofactor cytidylyltransferase